MSDLVGNPKDWFSLVTALCLQFCRWQVDNEYCNNTVLKIDMYRRGRLLLDIIDAAVFDYLIGNADRHMYEAFHTTDIRSSMMLILDNGKR